MIDTTPLRFRKYLLEKIQEPIIATDDKIRDKKLQYDNIREVNKYLSIFNPNSGKYGVE